MSFRNLKWWLMLKPNSLHYVPRRLFFSNETCLYKSFTVVASQWLPRHFGRQAPDARRQTLRFTRVLSTSEILNMLCCWFRFHSVKRNIYLFVWCGSWFSFEMIIFYKENMYVFILLRRISNNAFKIINRIFIFIINCKNNISDI